LDANTAAMLLGRVEPFRGLDEQARLTIVEHAGRRVVDKGQMVFWQDDPGEAMFVLLEGSVKLIVCSRDGELIELHRHDAPAIFGELALLDAGPRSASAEAVERSTLLVVTRAELLHLLRAEDQVAEALLSTLGAMVRRTTRQVSDLVFLDLQGRIARRLLALATEGDGLPRTRRVTQRGQADGEPGPAVARVPRLYPGRRRRLRDPRPGTVGAPGRAVEVPVIVS
jgi:CRP/FNR family transcriptional regulator, cyclic AMP receptor protein